MSREFVFTCHQAADTQALAELIGTHMNGGEVIEFVSDLGGGKTTFVKGLARGMGVSDVIQSPTFVISQLYKAERGLELHHFDFYRLDDPGIMRAELAESLAQSNAVVAIEWGDIVHDILPQQRITVQLGTPKDETRVIGVQVPKNLVELHEALAAYQHEGKLA
jgi:tRNA threonylcarbamoyladenosine biosynthesis protein TsaE